MHITTYTGAHFDPIEVKEEQIDIMDIAQALSMACRANGHIKRFYSVAQHSIACCLEAKERGYSKRVQLACLLHDGSEAYLSDIIRPIKAKLTEYLVIEDKLQHIIWNKYLGTPLSQDENIQVFEIDDDMLSYEFEILMPESISERYKNIITKPSLEFEDFTIVRDKFISLVEELSK